MFDSPFLYLTACSIKNRVLARFRRLRQPRYLVGAVVGIAYLYLVFFRRARPGRGVRRGAAGIPAGVLPSLQLAGTFVLWAVVVARWVVPASTQPLKLSGAERDLLLTAPMTRRRITRYKLLRSELAVLLSSGLMLVVAWRSVESALSFLVGTFLLFTAARLHLLGVALTRGARLSGAGGRRDLATTAATAVVAVSTAGALRALVPGLIAFARTHDVARAAALVGQIAVTPPASIALLPFTLAVKPVFAASLPELLAAGLPALALVALNYWWVLHAQDRADLSAAATEQETVAGKRTPSQAVRRPAPFGLAPRGPAEWAIVWKNLIMLGRYASAATLLRLSIPLVVVSAILSVALRGNFANAAAPFAAALACGLTLIGPYIFRNDLRQDMLQLSLLKTWPVSGERLLWGEILSPWLVNSVLVCVGVVVTAALALAVPPARLPWAARLSLGGSALILFPALTLAQTVVQNAAVVLFPGWVAIGPSRPRGVEAMGQGMLMFAGSALLLALGILPGVLVGGVVGFFGYRLAGWFAVVPASAIVAGLLLVETIAAVHLLGAALDRTDPTAVEAAP